MMLLLNSVYGLIT